MDVSKSRHTESCQSAGLKRAPCWRLTSTTWFGAINCFSSPFYRLSTPTIYRRQFPLQRWTMRESIPLRTLRDNVVGS